MSLHQSRQTLVGVVYRVITPCTHSLFALCLSAGQNLQTLAVRLRHSSREEMVLACASLSLQLAVRQSLRLWVKPRQKPPSSPHTHHWVLLNAVCHTSGRLKALIGTCKQTLPDHPVSYCRSSGTEFIYAYIIKQSKARNHKKTL